MSGKRTEQGAAEPAPKAVAIGKPEGREPEGQTSLSQVGGSMSRAFNKTALNAALSTLWRPSWLSEKARHDQQVAALHAMMAFEPADEIEGMIAAQAVAMHHGAMECFRRSMIPEQPAEAAARLRKDGASLARGMVDMVVALDRKRGKSGSQVVRVEHVTVQAGGQAIVGNVAPRAPGGGAESGTRQEPHAPPAGLARDAAQGAGGATLRGEDPGRVAVPVSGDDER